MTSGKNRIDIYVDGCWLTGGKTNPQPAGGWGAIVIESQDDQELVRWHPSGAMPSHIDSSTVSERMAIISALNAVKERLSQREEGFSNPTIVVHTDQEDLANMPHCVTPLQSPLVEEVESIRAEMGARIEYANATKRSNGTPKAIALLMDGAHHLATAAANEVRLEKQGFLGIPGTAERREGSAAQKMITRYRNLGWRDESETRNR